MTHEKVSVGFPALPWPREVLPGDLNRIREYKGDKRSLAESVAKFISGDEVQMLTTYIGPENYDKDRFFLEVGIRAYAHTALAFLTAAHTDAVGQPPPNFGNTDDLLLPAFDGVILGIPLTPGRGNLLNKQAWDENFALERVELDTIAEKLKGVLKTDGPLAVVDYYTAFVIKRIKENKLLNRNRNLKALCIEGIKHGKDRFHQLYDALSAES